MSIPIIEVKNIGKRYTISHQRGGYVALRDVLTNAILHPLRTFSRSQMQGKNEAFWALKDVSFTALRGESIGIIGGNGAGKSTLLKILTGITPPTEGEIVMHGRVSSLLEVGTGFHPELSGRENIKLNGAILGMTRTEIASKFDEIVAFAGIEKFLDTPVKHYSSGMYVRLAFSVAAHLEPDILLVDEVLAVGDAEFQKKCLGKMEEVTKQDGRTILFVSHNMAAIAALCQKVVVLERGKVAFFGPTAEAIQFYSERFSHAAAEDAQPSFVLNNDAVRFSEFTVNGTPSMQQRLVPSGGALTIGVRVDSTSLSSLMNVAYGIRRQSDAVLVAYSHAELEGQRLQAIPSTIEARFILPHLAPGDYIVEFSGKLDSTYDVSEKEIGFFTIPETIAFKGGLTFKSFPSILMADSEWTRTPL